jgi:hypothetical protein
LRVADAKQEPIEDGVWTWRVVAERLNFPAPEKERELNEQ